MIVTAMDTLGKVMGNKWQTQKVNTKLVLEGDIVILICFVSFIYADLGQPSLILGCDHNWSRFWPRRSRHGQ